MTHATPLSDLIGKYLSRPTDDAFLRLARAFQKSRVGVGVTGIRSEIRGEVISTAERPLALGLTDFPDNQRRILTFADPPAFEERFGARFNGVMDGDAVFKTALYGEDCKGVVVNSALKEQSVILDRAMIEFLVDGEKPPQKRWWWPF